MNIKKYNEFVNENFLEDTKRLGFFIKGGLQKLIGLYPLLNDKYNELKKLTKDRNHNPLISTKIDFAYQIFDINEIDISKLNDKLKRSTFFGDWKIYERKKLKNDSRPTLYLSKDNLKNGDWYMGQRLSDLDLYPEYAKKFPHGLLYDWVSGDYKKELIDFPSVILAAKVDINENLNDIINGDIKDIVDDFLLEYDNYLSSKIEIDRRQQYFNITLKVDNDNIVIVSNLIKGLIGESNFITDLLKVCDKSIRHLDVYGYGKWYVYPKLSCSKVSRIDGGIKKEIPIDNGFKLKDIGKCYYIHLHFKNYISKSD